MNIMFKRIFFLLAVLCICGISSRETCLALDIKIKNFCPNDSRGMSIERNYPEYDEYEMSEYFTNENCVYSEYLVNFLRSIKDKVATINEKEFSAIEKFCDIQNKYLEDSDILQSGTYGHRIGDHEALEIMFKKSELSLYNLIKTFKWK